MRDGQKREFARSLRRGMTDAERKLWRHLRDKRMVGFKFRRQHPVGRYVVDFACLDSMLIVELDGGQHAGAERDARRDAWLSAHGFRVLRFWNHEVLTCTDAVLASILAALEAEAAND